MLEIELTSGEFAKVDDIDYEYLNQWKWHCEDGYAVRYGYVGGEFEIVYMHEEVIRRARNEHENN